MILSKAHVVINPKLLLIHCRNNMVREEIQTAGYPAYPKGVVDSRLEPCISAKSIGVTNCSLIEN